MQYNPKERRRGCCAATIARTALVQLSSAFLSFSFPLFPSFFFVLFRFLFPFFDVTRRLGFVEGRRLVGLEH